MTSPIQLAATDVAPSVALSLSSAQVLSALVLAGLLGMIGQAVRAIVGLKKMNDDALSGGVSANDLFIASRLVTSEIIGFVVGVVTAFSLDIDRLVGNVTSLQFLLGIVAAGYAGTDIIEGFARRLGGTGGGATAPGAGSAGPPAPPPNPRRLPRPGNHLQQNQLEAYQAARDGLSDVASSGSGCKYDRQIPGEAR